MPYFCASRLRLACETALRSTYSCRLEMRCSGTKSHYSLQDFIVLMAPLVALVPFGPLTKWQRDKASRLGAMLLPWLLLSIVLAPVLIRHNHAIAAWLTPSIDQRGDAAPAATTAGLAIIIAVLFWSASYREQREDRPQATPANPHASSYQVA